MRTLFPGQQPNETVYLVIRKHWFYLFSQLMTWSVFLILLFLFDYYGPMMMPGLFQDSYLGYLNLFRNLYFIFLILGLLIIWVLYYVNVQLITNERIVDISQRSLFHHVVSELYLTKIEDVTGETEGIFETALGFGDVYVQTAGTEERFVFSRVPQPEKIEKMILDLSQQLQKMPTPIIPVK